MRISDWSSDVCSSDLLEQREQRGAVLLAVEPCDRVERRALHRQAVRLLILDHLEPVLNPPQHRIMIGQPRRDVGGDPSRLCKRRERVDRRGCAQRRLARSEEHTSELQSLMRISYAVFCWKKKRYQ